MIVDVFDNRLYAIEMKEMVNTAIKKMQKKHPSFEIYSAIIWTDPDARSSSICFDDKENSDFQVKQSFLGRKNIYEKYKDSFDKEQGPEYVKLLLKKYRRNRNPAEFKLRDLVKIENESIMVDDWAFNDAEECWQELEPELKNVAKYTLQKIRVLKLHPRFELAVNGYGDWYKYKWKIKQ